MSLKQTIKRLPILGPLAVGIHHLLVGKPAFPGSREYWEHRYAAGGTSGAGSYSILAEYKAEVLNRYVLEHKVNSVIELGCGDGNQLQLARYPGYLGLDVSPSVITACRQRFAAEPAFRFQMMDEYRGEKADLALSLDVIFHLVEDEVYEHYMRTLFAAAAEHVIVYSSNTVKKEFVVTHVRHRCHTDWVQAHQPGWILAEHIPNRYPYRGDEKTGSFADFYFYRRREAADADVPSSPTSP